MNIWEQILMLGNAMHQSEKICMSGYDIEEPEMLETNLI